MTAATSPHSRPNPERREIPINYLTRFGFRRTPQNEPILGTAQVPNSAGGFAWAVDDWTRLRRFLVLGSEGGSYYAGEAELTRENAEAVARAIAADGPRAVREIVAISRAGRAPKNDPAIFALAMAAAAEDEVTRAAALAAIPDVCRIGTHLFAFARYVEQFRGWGRALRRGVGRWYVEQPADKLAYQAVKYRQREGTSHRDLLRLAHPGAKTRAGNPRLPVSDEHARLFEWIVRGGETAARGGGTAAGGDEVARGGATAAGGGEVARGGAAVAGGGEALRGRHRRAPRGDRRVHGRAGGHVRRRDGAPRARARPSARGGQARAPRRCLRCGRRCSSGCR